MLYVLGRLPLPRHDQKLPHLPQVLGTWRIVDVEGTLTATRPTRPIQDALQMMREWIKTINNMKRGLDEGNAMERSVAAMLRMRSKRISAQDLEKTIREQCQLLPA